MITTKPGDFMTHVMTLKEPEDQPFHYVVTMRDYFAAKAVSGLIAQSNGTALGSSPAYAAEYAYAVADAMIVERKK